MNRAIVSQQTRKQLADTLKELLAEKPIDKISISDIVRRAGVNRKTFYYHFRDIPDLIAWILRTEVMERIVKFNVFYDYRKGIKLVLDYIEEYQSVIVQISQSPISGEVRELLCQGISMTLGIAIGNIERKRKETLEPDFREFIIEFYTEAIAGMIIRWAEDPSRRSREQIERHLIRIFDDTIANLKRS